MSQFLGGSGLALPPPQALYPAQLSGGSFDSPTNAISLKPGQELLIPAGWWWVSTGPYCVLQVNDPVTGTWRGFNTARHVPVRVFSDGFNYRVANLTSCPIASVVTNGGSNYVQASTTVTVNGGNSTWQAVVGGRLNATFSITAAGSGYGVEPIVHIAAPPAPGVPATAVAVMANGTISSITLLNAGAGYQVAPPVTIQPNPADPSINSISAATATCTLTGAGQVSAVLCTNPGVAVATTPTLTIGGVGTSAVASVVMLWTATGITLVNGGAGYTSSLGLTSFGGVPTATPSFTNPAIELTNFVPRQAQMALTVSGTTISALGTVYDGGLFATDSGTKPTAVVMATTAGGTVASLAFTLGGLNDSVILQPA